MSALAEVFESAPPTSNKQARANWRQRQWNASQRIKREQERRKIAAGCGGIDWSGIRIRYVDEPYSPAPRHCQWPLWGDERPSLPCFCGAD